MNYRSFAVVLFVAAGAAADEGMWTYDNFPSDQVKAKYGFAPTQQWLDHLRLSSVRLAQGCSASFVSENGLVITNHHCAHRCIEQLSNAKRDYVASGFYAKSEQDEIKCPMMEVNQLVEISDVTDQIGTATKGLSGQKYNDTLKSEMSKIEKACATSDQVRCDVVTLYQGGKYNLYKYRRFQDLRLVFAPEFPIAFFGGDPDNFNFPRYDLDVSFVRVYSNGKPAKLDHHLQWSQSGVQESDLTFVSGHPGRTSRLLTIAELEYERDFSLPRILLSLSEKRGMISEFQQRGPEQKRISNADLFYIENYLKALRGRREALVDKEFFQKKAALEQDFRTKVNNNPTWKKDFGDAWDLIAKTVQDEKKIYKPLYYLESEMKGRGDHPYAFESTLFGIARMLVRSTEELSKPNEKRLREYADSNMPAIKQALFSTAPIYDELEIENLTHSLTKFREVLGADEPRVKRVLGKGSPRELATALVRGTKLKNVKLRKALFDGGEKSVEGSGDAMIKFVRQVDPEARALRKQYEDEIQSVRKLNHERLAKARFAVYGTNTYPDATFTLRLSYGQVKGWVEDGKPVPPITTMGGAYERHSGRDPFALPQSWLAAKSKLDTSTPMNFCSTNDIIGGNSGSPVIDKQGEFVGLVFDGNIHSLGGEYGFDEKDNRTVAVHSAALIEALDKIYGAQRIIREVLPKASHATGSR